MPRDGSGNYHVPLGTYGIPDTTIASTPYNGYVDDVATDLNTPRPIVAGGTGASSANQALINLQAEKNKQVVTDYNSFAFVGGSFISAPGAAGAPTSGDYYVGTVLEYNSNSMIIQARNPLGASYTRVKSFTDGTWGAWTLGTDSSKVAKAGDTMTGSLLIQAPEPALVLRKAVGGHTSMLMGSDEGGGGRARWAVVLGNSTFESGSNIGSDFEIDRFDDAGTSLGAAIGIYRNDGRVAINSTVASSNSTSGALVIAGAGGLGVGGNVNAGGQVVASTNLVAIGDIYAGFGSAKSGTFRWGNDGTQYLTDNGSLFQLGGAPLAILNTTASSSPTTGALTVGGGLGVGGAINANGDLNVTRSGGVTGAVTFGQPAGGKYLFYDGTAFQLTGGNLNLPGLDISNTSPTPKLTFYVNTIKQSYIEDNGGSINVMSNAAGSAGMYIVHGANAWTAISDARLPWKKTARPLSALDKLEHIQLYENEVEGRLELFGKAQELFQAFPHVVAKGDDDPDFTPTGMFDGKIWGVSYERLGLVALQAVKELLAQVKLLEDRIAALEAAK